MKYLVTGADGFLGRHFLHELAARGIPARAMLVPNAPEAPLPGGPEIVRADLLNPASLAPAVAGVTHIVHLAARVHMMNDPAPDPEQAFFQVNVEGTKSLMEAACRAGARRFLLMSTIKAMGEEQTGTFDENSEPRPTTPYGRSKLAAERAMFELAARHGLGAVALRLPIVYGPGAKGNVLRLIEAAEAGRKLPFGRLANRRSMVYVETVVDAALRALDRPASAGQVYLVCDARPYGTAELYGAICRAMGKPPLLRNVPVGLLRAAAVVGDLAEFALRRKMPIDSEVVSRITGDLCFDSGKIQRELEWSPTISLEEGIGRMVAWRRQGGGPTPPAS
jgi:nucleoside-diphosphate-sugar epimerase